MNKFQKGNIQLILVIILMAALVLVVFLVQKRTNITPKASDTNTPFTYQQPASDVIESDEDLVEALSDLEEANVNMNVVENEIKRNDTDLVAF